MARDDDATRQLNALLRGELSAVQTYRSAIDSADGEIEDSDEVAVLRDMEEDHARACEALRQCIRQLGGEPVESPEGWGAWALAVQGTMKMFGNASALKSLKEGEEHGLKDYQDAIHDGNLDPSAARLVAEELIPAQTRHISILDRLIAAVR